MIDVPPRFSPMLYKAIENIPANLHDFDFHDNIWKPLMNRTELWDKSNDVELERWTINAIFDVIQNNR